jgi:hypothetical protein
MATRSTTPKSGRTRKSTKTGPIRRREESSGPHVWDEPTEVDGVPEISEVTAPHVRSAEWQAGHEVGRRKGVEEGAVVQTEVVLDVLRSGLRMFEQDDDFAEQLIGWVRSRLKSR